jgi:hypothetical protein
LIFCDDEDRGPFISTLVERCQKTAWQVHWSSHPLAELAARLRAETTVTVSWIAHRVAMGIRGHLAYLLYRNGQPLPGTPKSGQPSLII